MDTNKPLPYQIESDEGDWPGLAKLVEEMGELGTILGKIMSNGGKTAYWGGVNLLDELHDELSDVTAALCFFCEQNKIDLVRYSERGDLKLDRYEQWREENRTVTETGTVNDPQTQGRNSLGG